MFITVPATEPGADVTFDPSRILTMTYIDKRKLKSEVIISATDDEKPVTLVKIEHGVAFATHWSPEQILAEANKLQQLNG